MITGIAIAACTVIGIAAGYAWGYTDGLTLATEMMNMLCDTLRDSFEKVSKSQNSQSV